MLSGKRILLVIGGGIAAFKALDLIRRLREGGASVTPVLTRGAEQFVTPLSVSALAASKVYRELFDLTDEAEMGHIELSRAADLVAVVPATANLMGKMAGGLADDLASTVLMATDKRVLIAPAMNVRMWEHPATRRNLAALRADGVLVCGPAEGPMACGEFGYGRLAEVPDIVAAIDAALAGGAAPAPDPALPRWAAAGGPLSGRRVVVTSGPTREPIDPVRYIANRSSGAQGTAIARALAERGAEVVFVTGPAEVLPPEGVEVRRVETAREMLDAALAELPADAFVAAAAVADWRAEASGSKLKKGPDGPPALRLSENPDVLATVSRHPQRPALVVGFAAETEDVVRHAAEKRRRKGCDWIAANDVSPATGIMGGAENAVTLVTEEGAEGWPRLPKAEVAARLADRIAAALDGAVRAGHGEAADGGRDGASDGASGEAAGEGQRPEPAGSARDEPPGGEGDVAPEPPAPVRPPRHRGLPGRLEDGFRDALLWHLERDGTAVADLARAAGVRAEVIDGVRSGGHASAEDARAIAAHYGRSLDAFIREGSGAAPAAAEARDG